MTGDEPDEAPVPLARFTTDAFLPAHRHEAWVNRDWPAIGPIFDAVPTGAFHNHSERMSLGGLTIHYSDMAAQSYARTARRARRDGVDGLMVELLLAGETVGDAAGRVTRNAVGGMAFNDLAQPHRHRASDTRSLLLAIPRAVAEGNGLDVAALHGAHVSAPAAQLVSAQLLGIRAARASLDAALAGRLAQTVLDLVAVAVDAQGLRAPASSEQARAEATAQAARRLIETNIGSPHLGVDWLCGALRISRSRLYRLFEADGGVQAYIRGQRLEAVRRLLAGPADGARIGDLAERWGFTDGAHLSRMFRQRFGVTPSEYRAHHIR